MATTIMTPEACATARSLLGWSEYDLAGRAHCSALTVRSFERRRHKTSAAIKSAIRRAFDEVGVAFEPLAEGGFDVRVCAVRARLSLRRPAAG